MCVCPPSWVPLTGAEGVAGGGAGPGRQERAGGAGLAGLHRAAHRREGPVWGGTRCWGGTGGVQGGGLGVCVGGYSLWVQGWQRVSVWPQGSVTPNPGGQGVQHPPAAVVLPLPHPPPRPGTCGHEVGGGGGPASVSPWFWTPPHRKCFPPPPQTPPLCLPSPNPWGGAGLGSWSGGGERGGRGGGLGLEWGGDGRTVLCWGWGGG